MCAYTLVLLHNIIPHHHNDGNALALADSFHNKKHHHNHGHDSTSHMHQSHADVGILHSLGHLMDVFDHGTSVDNNLYSLSDKTKIPHTKFERFLVILMPHTFPAINTQKEKKRPYYSALQYKQLLSSALPLRAPPARS